MSSLDGPWFACCGCSVFLEHAPGCKNAKPPPILYKPVKSPMPPIKLGPMRWDQIDLKVPFPCPDPGQPPLDELEENIQLKYYAFVHAASEAAASEAAAKRRGVFTRALECFRVACSRIFGR